MIPCEQAHDLLEPYHDGELAPEVAVEVRRHVRDCGRCRTVLGRMRRLEDLLRSTEPEVDPDPEYVDRQVRRIRSRLRERQVLIPIRMLAAAAAGALVVALIWAFHPGPGETTDPAETRRTVARLVREYLEAREAEEQRIAAEIVSRGAEAVPVVCRMVREAEGSDQVKLHPILAQLGKTEEERRLLLKYLGGGRESDGKVVLTEWGWDQEADAELAARLSEILLQRTDETGGGRLQRFAEKTIEQLARYGGEARREIKASVMKWLQSDNPELVRKALKIASATQLSFTDAEIVELLQVKDSSVREGALQYLRKRYGRENLGPDPAAWRRVIRK